MVPTGFIIVPLLTELMLLNFQKLGDWYFGIIYSFPKCNLRKLKVIVVNSIAPGLMLQSDDIVNINISPSERYSTASEIGNLAVVMVSDMGKMVNGDTMYAMGGCGLLTLDDYD